MYFSPDNTENVLIMRSEGIVLGSVLDLWKLTTFTSEYESKDACSGFRNVQNVTFSSRFLGFFWNDRPPQTD